ncbi:MAG: hypothetical protein AAGI17_11355 [Planctomycetota bacterium]
MLKPLAVSSFVALAGLSLTTITAVATASASAAAPADAIHASQLLDEDITGLWYLDLNTELPVDDAEVTFSVEEDDEGNLVAVLGANFVEEEFTANVTFDEDSGEFSVTFAETPYGDISMTGSVDGDVMDGVMKLGATEESFEFLGELD